MKECWMRSSCTRSMACSVRSILSSSCRRWMTCFEMAVKLLVLLQLFTLLHQSASKLPSPGMSLPRFHLQLGRRSRRRDVVCAGEVACGGRRAWSVRVHLVSVQLHALTCTIGDALVIIWTGIRLPTGAQNGLGQLIVHSIDTWSKHIIFAKIVRSFSFTEWQELVISYQKFHFRLIYT